MVKRTHLALKAHDRSYFAILKKEIHALAVSAGFSERKVAEIDIIVAEMVSNLVKHAGGGQILIRPIEENRLQGIELIAIDEGPGMTDVSRMVADGVSTKNTLGHGLGTMKRLSHVFQVYSQKDWGTAILCRVFEDEPSRFVKPAKADIRAVIVPKPGEEQCGDGSYYKITADHVKLFLGDGLGHGPFAAAAVEQAGQAFLDCNETDPVEIIRSIHRAARKTRGLVGTVAVFDLKENIWRLCGVGNIVARIMHNGTTKNHMTYNGIIGLNIPKTMKAQEMAYESGQYIVMCSDGIKSRWETTKYPSILRYDLSLLSAALLKDFARNTDDMSVMACKINV